MPFNIELTDKEKEHPIDDWQDLGVIMHSILKRELKIAVLPPATKKTLIKPVSHSNKKYHTILTDGSNLLDAQVEYFWTMGIRADKRLAFVDLVAIGDSMLAKVGISEALRGLAYYDATQLAVVHNHPSGKLEFSEQDLRITKNIMRAGLLIDRPLYDHLILTTGDGVTSLVKEGLFDDLHEMAMLEELSLREVTKRLKKAEQGQQRAEKELKHIEEEKQRTEQERDQKEAELEKLKALLAKNNINY